MPEEGQGIIQRLKRGFWQAFDMIGVVAHDGGPLPSSVQQQAHQLHINSSFRAASAQDASISGEPIAASHSPEARVEPLEAEHGRKRRKVVLDEPEMLDKVKGMMIYAAEIAGNRAKVNRRLRTIDKFTQHARAKQRRIADLRGGQAWDRYGIDQREHFCQQQSELERKTTEGEEECRALWQQHDELDRAAAVQLNKLAGAFYPALHDADCVPTITCKLAENESDANFGRRYAFEDQSSLDTERSVSHRGRNVERCESHRARDAQATQGVPSAVNAVHVVDQCDGKDVYDDILDNLLGVEVAVENDHSPDHHSIANLVYQQQEARDNYWRALRKLERAQQKFDDRHDVYSRRAADYHHALKLGYEMEESIIEFDLRHYQRNQRLTRMVIVAEQNLALAKTRAVQLGEWLDDDLQSSCFPNHAEDDPSIDNNISARKRDKVNSCVAEWRERVAEESQIWAAGAAETPELDEWDSASTVALWESCSVVAQGRARERIDRAATPTNRIA